MDLNAVINTIGDVYCPECELQKCIFEHYCKEDSGELYHYSCPKCDADCLVQGILFKDQTQQAILKDAGIHSFRAKTTRGYEREQKERVENDKGMESLRQFLRKKPTNQRSPAKRTTSKKRSSPCRVVDVSSSYWLFNILKKSFFKQLQFISFQP